MENITEHERYTVLRQFLTSLGLDYHKLTLKQIRKWASTKHYKDFLKLHKIKKITDEAKLHEDFINIYYYDLLKSFYENDLLGEEITENEVNSILPILLEGIRALHRGKYKKLAQRQQAFKDKMLSTLYSGGKISDEGQMMYRGMGKHSHLALQKNRVMLMKRRTSPTGATYYHRKVQRIPGSGGGY